MIGQFDLCLMKSLEDLRKASLISKSSNYKKMKGVCVGDLKYDKIPKVKKIKRSELGLKNEKIIILGSSHNGEEDLILDSYRYLKNKFKDLKLIIAPRKTERKTHVGKIFSEFNTAFWSENESFDWNNLDNLIIDKIGFLAQVYSVADIALSRINYDC